MTARIVVVGGVAAGMSAASQARRRLPTADVVVLERGPNISYSACGMPYNIGDVSRDTADLEILTPAAARERGLDVRTGHTVRAIDPAARTVSVESATGTEQLSWDSLVIATGAFAIRPPWPGMTLPGVFVLRELTDAVAIKQYLAMHESRSAVIVGAGYIGLEMADALRGLGLAVTVVERAPGVLPGWAPLIVEAATTELVRCGVQVRTGVSVRDIVEHDGTLSLLTDAGTISGDVVIVAVGVRPNVALAQAAGVALGATGAIATDSGMRTNVPGIFAAGDCVEVPHLVSGRPAWIPLGTTANKTGKVAGANAAGGDETFRGIVGSAGFKLFDREVARTGIDANEAAALGLDAVVTSAHHHSRARNYPGDQPIDLLLVTERGSGRLLGAQAIGGEAVAKRIDVLATALHARMTVADVEALDLTYAPPFAPVYDPVLIAATVARKAAAKKR
jgi:NADPH-dependent 2,4-dienoyl-CoA reductase/sulfur reductase-like enzyme